VKEKKMKNKVLASEHYKTCDQHWKCPYFIDGRESLANEIRKTLKTRGYWSGDSISDVITAVALALDKKEQK